MAEDCYFGLKNLSVLKLVVSKMLNLKTVDIHVKSNRRDLFFMKKPKTDSILYLLNDSK